jgi:hypothetical protein
MVTRMAVIGASATFKSGTANDCFGIQKRPFHGGPWTRLFLFYVGWSHGKKTGWGTGTMPPGLMNR